MTLLQCTWTKENTLKMDVFYCRSHTVIIPFESWSHHHFCQYYHMKNAIIISKIHRWVQCTHVISIIIVKQIWNILSVPRSCIYGLWEAFNDIAEGFGLTIEEFEDIIKSALVRIYICICVYSYMYMCVLFIELRLLTLLILIAARY